MIFDSFDPLATTSSRSTEAQLQATRRQIRNILSSYVGWYDPFAELIQNALDSVELMAKLERENGNKNYVPSVYIKIDILANTLTVADNGVGLDRAQFEQFLAPNFSFKSGETRGHKGVGATYIAYGFNDVRITSLTDNFKVAGMILHARRWLDDQSPSSNPRVEPDPNVDEPALPGAFHSGVSVQVKFDDTTHPKQLRWIQADSPEAWLRMLSVKTALGAIKPFDDIRVSLVVVKSNGISEEIKKTGARYFQIFTEYGKTAKITDIFKIEDNLYKTKGVNFRHPDSISNLDVVYDTWDASDLEVHRIDFDADDLEIIRKHKPRIFVEFAYTARLWPQINDKYGIRTGSARVFKSGIQLAANNMPQGDLTQIPLVRNIGRQNQIQFLFHFSNYSPDLGRKGFHRELVEFAKDTSRKLTDSVLSKVKPRLKANTGVAPDIVREQQIADWKSEMITHENSHPLVLESPYFFQPVQKISITSVPTREQDVIALFNQLIAGGVIRGIRVMSTNERFTYDGLYRISFELDAQTYEYDSNKNPLGISSEVVMNLIGKSFDPKVLEYKFSLDGLLEDFDSSDKNINDVNLCVAWTVGTEYREKYGITSLLIPGNMSQRQYHGVTHVLTDAESGARMVDLIILSDMIAFLNDRVAGEQDQVLRYP